MTSSEKQPIDLLREMFPDLSEEQLVEADEKFGRYLLLAWRICALESNSPADRDGDVDAVRPDIS